MTLRARGFDAALAVLHKPSAAVLIGLLAAGCKEPEPPPPAIGQLPSWSLVDQRGATIGSSELEGKVWVASFFFTSCRSICPKLMGQVKKLQELAASEKYALELVSFTVDPETDTPEKLAAYGQKLGADFARWHFVTGERAPLHALIRKGFMTHVGEKTVDEGGVMDIAHGGRFMLVDHQGALRGVFDSDDDGLRSVLATARRLERGKRPQ